MTRLDAYRASMAQLAATIPGVSGRGVACRGVSGDGPVFRAPWQARVFALIVAAVEDGLIPWLDFQTRLAQAITGMERRTPGADTETLYFDCWLHATEDTLQAAGLIAEDDIAHRIDSLRASIADVRAAQTSGPGSAWG